MAFIVASIVGAGGAIAGGLIASHGATSAANTQAAAADKAGQLQYNLGEDQLGFEKGVYGNQQSEIAPYLNMGYAGLANLGYLTGLVQAPGARPMPASPGAPGTGATSPPEAAQASAPADPFAKYQDLSLSNLGQYAGDPNVSPNAQTTQAWQAQGIPFKNINGVAVRTDTLSSPSGTAPANPASSGINIPQNPASLVNPSLGAPGSLLTPFTAPDSVTEQNDPGYKFRLQQGQQALENSAAARGGLLSGGTAKALADWSQQDASNEYQNVYNRAFNTFETNQTNTWNRLAAMAGLGQEANTQLLGAGNSVLGATGGTTASIGSQVGQNINNAGAARASGYVGSANALSGALGGGISGFANLYALSQMLGGGVDSNTIAVNWSPGMSGAYNALYGSPGPGM